MNSKSAVATMTDGNSDAPIIRQEIEYTDYPEPECELWCVRSPGEPAVLMLPSDY